MPSAAPWGRARVAALLISIAFPVHSAEILIEGLTDRSVTTDQAWFRVPSTPGTTESALLDGRVVPFDVTNRVTDPDYHQLMVTRTASDGSLTESREIQFIVRASERGNTEWGLPPWTPPAVVTASEEELAPAQLRMLLPGRFPTGLPIPFAVWLDGPDDRPFRAHARLTSASHDPVLLRRGAGSGQIRALLPAGLHPYAAFLPGHALNREILVEDVSAWQEAGTTISGEIVWPPDARMDLNHSLSIPTGSSLTIGSGSVIRLGSEVDLEILGQLFIHGTPERPVVFLPADPEQPWGGLIVRGESAHFEAESAIFTGSGADPTWFDTHSGYDVHRREQALLLVDGATARLRNCAAVDGHGQFGHGKNADLEIDRTLIQRFITGGEYNGGSVRIRDSALLEFPVDDPVFDDGDNDAIYFTSGRHEVRDTVIGWAKDDGIDAGSGGAGSVLASNVWVEAVFHEAFAWSGTGRLVTNLHCVALHCGQGIECGWSGGTDSPRVFADNCLCLGNASGLRFGDNYDWTYDGFLQVTNSLALHNHRDIFDLNWDDWTPHPDQLDLRGNLVSTPHPRYPDNTRWDPELDGPRLATFLDPAAAARPGVGFAIAPGQTALPGPAGGLPVGLSRFSTQSIRVAYTIETPAGIQGSGTLDFTPGQTLQRVELPPRGGETLPIRVRLLNPVGAEVTGPSDFYLLPVGTGAPATLIPGGSVWRYLDTGLDPGSSWRLPDYDDSGWSSGPAELGYGDGNEITIINGGPSGNRPPTTWFRHRFELPDPRDVTELEFRVRRDDGAIGYLNGTEVFRSNVPEGPADAITYTGQETSSESQFFLHRVPATFLVQGRNTVAVEVHQVGPASSDVSFDLELAALPAPRLDFFRTAGETVLLWSNPAFLLENALTIEGPWLPVPTAASPFPLIDAATRFYRLRQPAP